MITFNLTPAEQVFAQGQAVEQDPSLATAQGWAMREVSLTLGALASGKSPHTILGAMITPLQFVRPPISKGDGMSLPQLCAIGNFDVHNYNGIITTREMLSYLVQAGLLAYDEPPEDTVEAVIRRDEGEYYGPSYILAQAAELRIERLDPKGDEELQRKYDERAALYHPPRRRTLGERWRIRQWVKEHREKFPDPVTE